MCITLMPVFRHDSPYYAPLSSLAWSLYTRIRLTLFRILHWVAKRCKLSGPFFQFAFRLYDYHEFRTSLGMAKGFELTAEESPSEIDARALMWTYESLDKDHEREQFFAGIPGFCSSTVVVREPLPSLNYLKSRGVAVALKWFLERTWSSHLLSKTIKIRRFVICIRAIDAAHISRTADELFSEFA